jgi:hypothetical protein
VRDRRPVADPPPACARARRTLLSAAETAPLLEVENPLGRAEIAAWVASRGIAVPPPPATKRVFIDNFASGDHCRVPTPTPRDLAAAAAHRRSLAPPDPLPPAVQELAAAADAAMQGLPTRNGHCNLPVGAVGALAARRRGAAAGAGLLPCRAGVLAHMLLYQTRVRLMASPSRPRPRPRPRPQAELGLAAAPAGEQELFGVAELFEAGAVLTRLTGAAGALGGADGGGDSGGGSGGDSGGDSGGGSGGDSGGALEVTQSPSARGPGAARP